MEIPDRLAVTFTGLPTLIQAIVAFYDEQIDKALNHPEQMRERAGRASSEALQTIAALTDLFNRAVSEMHDLIIEAMEAGTLEYPDRESIEDVIKNLFWEAYNRGAVNLATTITRLRRLGVISPSIPEEGPE